MRCALCEFISGQVELPEYASSNVVFVVQLRRIPLMRESAWRPGKSWIK